MGYEDTADTFTYLCRYALFDNSTEGSEFLANIPGYIFKITPAVPDTSTLYPYPYTIVVYGSNNWNFECEYVSDV